uniref:Uncharacterized protein n=1 Tax=Trachysalambria curvirostris majanivirus TaxID=2984281 RepID=A0A9C7C900_9VIRU|nr:MAG: hypothetical protein [Trachysalambria curvirostris majanivirus]
MASNIPFLDGTAILILNNQRNACLYNIQLLQYMINTGYKENVLALEHLLGMRDDQARMVIAYDENIKSIYNCIRHTVREMYNNGIEKPRRIYPPAEGYWDECEELTDPRNIPILCDPRNYAFYYYDNLVYRGGL